MERTRTRPSVSSHRPRTWRLFAVSILVAALGIGMSAVPAHADTFRTATATGSSTNALSARANAIAQWALQFAAVRDPRAPVNPAVPYLGRTLPVTHPGEFRAAEWFTLDGLRLVRLAGRVCIEEMAAAVAGLTNGDVFRDVDAALAEFTELFAEEEIPVRAYPRPVRLAHGDADALPAVLSDITAAQLTAAGTDVAYTPVPGADHLTVLAAVNPPVLAWTGQLLASARS